MGKFLAGNTGALMCSKIPGIAPQPNFAASPGERSAATPGSAAGAKRAKANNPKASGTIGKILMGFGDLNGSFRHRQRQGAGRARAAHLGPSPLPNSEPLPISVP